MKGDYEITKVPVEPVGTTGYQGSTAPERHSVDRIAVRKWGEQEDACVVYAAEYSYEEICGAEDGSQNNGADWTYGSYGDRATTLDACLKGQVNERARRKASDLLAKCRPVIDRYSSQKESAKRRRVFREEGSELDMDRVLSLDSRCWSQTQRGRKARTFRLVLNSCLSCGNGEDDFTEIGAMAAAVCEALERLGFNVEVHVAALVKAGSAYSIKKPGDGYETWIAPMWKLKAAEEPIDVERVLSVAVQGMFRDCTFGVYRTHFGGSGGLGSAMDPSNDEAVKAAVGADYIIGKGWTRDGQAAYLDGILADLLGERPAS
jgi:hypothetical protein